MERPSIGVVLQGPIASLSDSAKRCEAAGASAIWLGEYFQSGFVRAAVVLASTGSVAVGSHVAQAFARSPLATALAASELHELGGGRFVLGLGSQLPEANQRWHAFETARPLADLDEYVAAVRALLAAPPGVGITLPGPRWPLSVPGFRTSGPTAVTIGVGCARPRSIELATRVGDIVLGHLLWTPAVVATVAERLARTGRIGVPITVSRMFAPRADPGARADAARALAHYALTGAYASLLAPVDVRFDVDAARDDLLAALRSDDGAALEHLASPLIDTFCVEDGDALRRHADALAAAGAAHVALVTPARRTDPTSTERYEQQLPALLAEYGPGSRFSP
jgi:alkanesulfonate monooxygenase SsuD/methylene tetrahydromethanopterin reductase-like flavin-dependent oxidoreductase (luciferase family)